MSIVQRQSKKMSFLLRHQPESGNLTLSPEGWVPVEELLASVGMTREQLAMVVEQNDKNRFEWDRESDRIRARQGHSVAVDLGLTPIAPPAVLLHGTTRQAFELIQSSGAILPMSRQLVHLSRSREVAEDVAGRRSRGEAIILRIDASAMVAAGLEFFESTNGVFLTQRVPVEFILGTLGE